MKVFLAVLCVSSSALAAEGAAKSVTLKASLLDQLKTSHDQQDWFVPVKPALEGVTAAQASWKPQGVTTPSGCWRITCCSGTRRTWPSSRR